MVDDQQLTGFHGRGALSDDSGWTALCATTPVDHVLYVQCAPFPIQ